MTPRSCRKNARPGSAALIAALCSFGLLGSLSSAQSAGQAAGDSGPPRISCPKTAEPPAIDGVLDDPCWQRAARVTEFYLENRDVPSAEPTEGLICQDREHLYVAFRCRDSKPEEIKANQRKRGGTMRLDDSVVVQIDTYNQHREAYWFEVNPRGTQNESMLGGDVPKIEWRGDWRAAARKGPGGWSAELAIPFSILRYPNGQDTWGIALQRRVAREYEWSIWPRVGGWSTGEKAAQLTDLELPPYRERAVVLPYAVAERGGETGEELDFGLDIKRPLASGLRLYGTYNPDFRNIEDVVETIDFTYTERYLPERRPFFVETWHGPSAVFYTRRVGQVTGGTALTGQVGRHMPAVLLVDAVEQGRVAAMSDTYSLGPASDVSMALAGQQGAPTPDNLAGMVRLNLGRNTAIGTDTIGAGYYRSNTEGEGGDGHISELYLDAQRGQRRTGFWASVSEVTADYNPSLGFAPERGIRRVSGGTSYWKRHEKGRVRVTSWWSSFGAVESLTDAPSYHWVSMGGGRDFHNNRSQSLGISYGEREGFTDAGLGLSYGWNTHDMYRSGSAYLEVGERLGGRSLFGSLRKAMRPGENLSLELRAEYLRMTSPVSPQRRHQVVVTGTYDLSDERTISTRAVEREEGFNVYFTYRQAVRRGMDAYVIVGDPNARKFDSRIAVKTVWAFFP